MDAKVGHLDRPPTVFPTVAAQAEGHPDLVKGGEVRGISVLADADPVSYTHLTLPTTPYV